jgi:hypothetical protein
LHVVAYFTQLVRIHAHHVSPAGPPINVGNVIAEVSTVAAALFALATVIVALRALGVARRTLAAGEHANKDAAVERQAADRERKAADADRKAAELDRQQARADREHDRKQVLRDRYRGQLDRVARGIEMVNFEASLDPETTISSTDWQTERRTLRILATGLAGKFPSLDGLLDDVVMTSRGQVTSAANTARGEVQQEIERLAAEDAAGAAVGSEE